MQLVCNWDELLSLDNAYRLLSHKSGPPPPPPLEDDLMTIRGRPQSQLAPGGCRACILRGRRLALSIAPLAAWILRGMRQLVERGLRLLP